MSKPNIYVNRLKDNPNMRKEVENDHVLQKYVKYVEDKTNKKYEDVDIETLEQLFNNYPMGFNREYFSVRGFMLNDYYGSATG